MVVGEASIHNIMGGMESTGGVRLHNHKRKLKQRFDIIKKLGQGTYGKVQLGINKETGQEVAIKTIKKCKIETEADLIRIRREIQIMSSVQHPNIIHIYEVFENREKMVLVMEYAAGGELYDYLSERKVLSEQEARRIFRQISTAVFYCHKHKICHRDLKLENILLDQLGNAKIADFGLSNVFDEQRLLSTFCGSPLYASPEIVKGTPYHGPEVDCWSLGVLLYTLVYGAMPFDGSNFKRLVKQISQSDYFEPKKPSPASPLIKDMLTVCPAKRADIEKICTHWWVNEGYEQNCLDIAEDLAAQTPVRLDLLLSIVPQSASAEKLLVGDQQNTGDTATNMSSETIVPTRCHSVGSLMELDRRDLLEEEPRTSAAGDAKRKLETTPSMDETAAEGVKRKEGRPKRKEKPEEKDIKTYRSASRHHSAPIPNAITEETMDIDQVAISNVPTTKTVDLNNIEATAACLELIQECKEKSPSKERSVTPVSMTKVSVDNSVVENNLSKDIDENVMKVEKPVEISDRPERFIVVPTVESSMQEKNSEDSNSQDVPKIESNIETNESQNFNSMNKEPVKLKEKSLSLDSDSGQLAEGPAKPTERRRSKIFETTEKFNQIGANTEVEKPKKIFIPGVNVGGAKRAFERKASLSGMTTLPTIKPNASKVIIDVPKDKEPEKVSEKVTDEAKKRAVDIITGAIGKPPMQRKLNGSPPISPLQQDPKKLVLKKPLSQNDIKNASATVSTPITTKSLSEESPTVQPVVVSSPVDDSSNDALVDEPKMSSKMEITLKSATLPRRKTSKAEITLSGVKSPENVAFKSEVEAKIDAFHPQRLRTQRSEVAFPVAAAVPQANRSSSLEPDIRAKYTPKERIIPIQVEPGHQPSPPPSKPPMPQRSMSQRSSSLSRQSTADSDTDSALGSTAGPEPIRKSPREYIIPIAVEGGGYVTPRSGSVEPESNTSTPTTTTTSRSRFSRPRRMSSLLSDASEDESPFSTLHRDSEDLLQRHMHRLRSSRPSRQTPEHADSLSSGEDDDDDGFELLTAENLFSTLLSRVRSLTQRLNVDDNRSGFPNSRLLGRLGSNSPLGQSQAFWGLNKPLSRRISESPFRHSMSRDSDIFGRKDSTATSNAHSPGSPSSHGSASRSSVFDVGSNTLPRDNLESHEDVEAERLRKEAQESLRQSFTPSLARRLSRQLMEQSRQGTPRPLACDLEMNSPRQERADRLIRRANSLLETGSKSERDERARKRSISMFDDEDRFRPPLPPRQSITLTRRYKDTDKIQEESNDRDACENGDRSENPSTSSSGESTSNTDKTSMNFEDRLLAAENLIKESKLKNLGPTKFNPNLSSSYLDTDKCDKNPLTSLTDADSCIGSKRRSCIPSLRLRSGSLTREPSLSSDRRKSFAGSQDTLAMRSTTPDRSILGMLFRSGSYKDTESKDTSKEKPKQRRISRFLRPDFFDTPREESEYVKEKEAKKAAENERRKSRFMKKRNNEENNENSKDEEKSEMENKSVDEKPEKELKNVVNLLRRDKSNSSSSEKLSKKEEAIENKAKSEKESKGGFLHSLEKKLQERFRSSDDSAKSATSSATSLDNKLGKFSKTSRENSAPPMDHEESPVPPEERRASAEGVPEKKVETSRRSRVSSVFGLFKNSDSKQSSVDTKNQNASKLKKSPTKETKSGSPTESASKIPTKFDVKPVRKYEIGKKSPEKVFSESKRSPPKEKLKESPPKERPKESPPKEKAKESPPKEKPKESLTRDKKLVIDKQSKDIKKSGERLSSSRTVEKQESVEEKRVSPSKIKKSNGSVPTRNGSAILGKSEAPSEIEKKVKKIVKPKTVTTATMDKESADGAKKKKIVKVVKKVMKKSSDSSDSKSEEKDKSTVKITKKPSVALKKDTSPDKSKIDNKLMDSNESSKKEDSPRPNSKTEVTSKEKIKPAEISQRNSSERETKPSRHNLKLDLSKISQKTFRRSPPEREPRKASIELNSTDEVTDRATRTSNKIVGLNDKPLRSKENTDQSNHLVDKLTPQVENTTPEVTRTDYSRSNPVDEELFSPTEENESFDSWSLCSADLNYHHSGAQSPISPVSPSYAYGPSSSGNSESIIDRIRRRSFYSRFNDRKRASLTAPPPGVARPSSQSRKYSFDSPRDRKSSSSSGLNKSNRRSERASSYADPKWSLDSRSRLSDNVIIPYGTDLKSPIDQYSSLSSSYDPLQRYYLRSPVFDSSGSRRRYRGSETDTDFVNYASTLPSSSSINGDSYSISRTLPRKFGSTVGHSDPKTVEYFEELLQPTHPEYLIARKSPISCERQLSRHENGFDASIHPNSRRKSYATRIGELDEDDIDEPVRKSLSRLSDSKDLSTTSPEPSIAHNVD